MTTSLPWMNRNRGAAGKKRTPLAMMVPVIAPERPLPLDSWEARRGARSPSSMRTSSLPARPRRRFGFASTIVPQAISPFGINTRPCTLTSSATSKSTLLPAASWAEESSRASFSGTGEVKCRREFRLRCGRWIGLRSGCGLLGTRSRGLLDFVRSDGLRRALCRDGIRKASRDEQKCREKKV